MICAVKCLIITEVWTNSVYNNWGMCWKYLIITLLSAENGLAMYLKCLKLNKLSPEMGYEMKMPESFSKYS